MEDQVTTPKEQKLKAQVKYLKRKNKLIYDAWRGIRYQLNLANKEYKQLMKEFISQKVMNENMDGRHRNVIKELKLEIKRLKDEYVLIRNELNLRRDEAKEYQKANEEIARYNVASKIEIAIKNHTHIDQDVLDKILNDIFKKREIVDNEKS